jgi:hypothetical protein
MAPAKGPVEWATDTGWSKKIKTKGRDIDWIGFRSRLMMS